MAFLLVAVWAFGRLAAGLAGRLLGPTDQDRLQVALTRLAAETAHTRLARDLHDGIGHALTIISVQASGGRAVLDRDPPRAGAALATIESTAREALAELDGMLGLLRADSVAGPGRDAARSPEPDLGRLPALFDTHRSAGMDLTAEIEPLGDLPRLVSTTTYRIVAEALANAQRHAGPGTVRLRVERTRDRPTGSGNALVVEVTNPLPGEVTSGAGPGRGLAGIGERAALFGGTVRSGVAGGGWVLRAEIPTGAPGE